MSYLELFQRLHRFTIMESRQGAHACNVSSLLSRRAGLVSVYSFSAC